MSTITLRYETDAMAMLRDCLQHDGKSNAQIDEFKACLILLERRGFSIQLEQDEPSDEEVFISDQKHLNPEN